MKVVPCLSLAASFLLLTGCQNSPETPRAVATGQQPQGGPAAEVDEAGIRASLAKLSPEDRRLAEEQRFCAVMNDSRLGSMGTPVKVMVKDQPVFLCCKGCSKKAQNNPDLTLAKVKELKGRNAPSPEKSGHNREEHGRQDHGQGGHKGGEHKQHKHGEHRDEAPPHGSVKVGDKVPDFSVRTLDGQSVKLSALRKDERGTKGGVVVLSFWCSTCDSCRDVERPLAKLCKDYGGQAAVLALDANADETAERVAAFVKEKGLDLPVVLDPTGSTADLFGVRKTTTTVVIDGDGVLRYCGQFRRRGGGSAEEALKAVLAGKEVAVKTTPHNG
jgi:peroxiredoxin